MDNKERLLKLKKLKIERDNGPLFKSSDECMEWIDNVAPLLKYDVNHYETFSSNAQFVRVTTLSADRLMSHLNPMIGVVNQAIIELENNIKSPQIVPSPTPDPTENSTEPNTIPETTPNPSSDSTNHIYDWYKKPLGIITLGIITALLVAIIIWCLKVYGDIDLS